MKFYNEEKLLKLRNILIVTVLALLALLLFFRVYDNFAKQIKLVTSTIFPFILSFVIVYCLMPFIDMISEKNKNDIFLKNDKLNELEKVEKMNISDSEKRKKIELFNEISQSKKKKRTLQGKILLVSDLNNCSSGNLIELSFDFCNHT